MYLTPQSGQVRSFASCGSWLDVIADCGCPVGHRTWVLVRPQEAVLTAAYCWDLLCLLTCSAVRRIRRLIASCSLRANASITAMSLAVGVGLSRKSARRSQGT